MSQKLEKLEAFIPFGAAHYFRRDPEMKKQTMAFYTLELAVHLLASLGGLGAAALFSAEVGAITGGAIYLISRYCLGNIALKTDARHQPQEFKIEPRTFIRNYTDDDLPK